MSTDNIPISTIEVIAAEIERDISKRGLRPGDRYLTASEASKVFSVSSMKVHRAMQELAGRELLVRQRSRGTFVGPKFRSSSHVHASLDSLHLVMDMDYHVTQNFTTDTLVGEFSRSIPNAAIEVHHVQENVAIRHVNKVIDRIGDSQREGLVLVRCSRDVQQRVSESGIPSVVFGQAYPGVNLSCVMHDQETVGRLLAEAALSRSNRSIILFTHARWRYGDHAMIDKATEALGAAGVKLQELKIRSLPPERAAIQQVVQEELRQDDPPSVFLCRSDFYARIVSEMIVRRRQSDWQGASGGVRASESPLVVSGGHSPDTTPECFSRIVSTLTLRQEVEQILQMLEESVQQAEESEAKTYVIPVKLLES